MSGYLDRPVYDDVAEEALHDWRAEKPDDVRPEDVLSDDELLAYYAEYGDRPKAHRVRRWGG